MPARRFCLARRVDAPSPMSCCRPRFALILWIAILAILWGVTAPTLASVRGATASTLWVEICTSNGTQWVALPSDASADDRSDLPDSTHAAQDHCPYCRLQQDWPDVVHAPGVLVLADGSVRHTPRARPAAPVPPLALRAAHHSRAPPLF